METKKNLLLRLVGPVCLALLLNACGGSGGGDVGDVTGTGSTPTASGLTLRLTDAKVNNLEAVRITSYNVCYTKLLRISRVARRADPQNDQGTG